MTKTEKQILDFLVEVIDGGDYATQSMTEGRIYFCAHATMDDHTTFSDLLWRLSKERSKTV